MYQYKKNRFYYFVGVLFLFFLLVFSTILQAINYDRIRVKINHYVITENEIDIGLIQYFQQRQIPNPSPKDQAKARTQVTQRLIEETLLDIRADELNVTISDDELDEEVDKYKKRMRFNDLTFEEFLERQHFSLSEFKEMYLRQIKRNRVVGMEVHAKINVTDEDLRKFYQKQTKEIQEIRARHILRRIPQNATPEQIKKAHEEAIWIRNELLQGKKFSELAYDYSQDPSAKKNHGDLGYFKPKEMLKQFAEGIAKLPLKTLSEPIRTPLGFHIVEVLDKKTSVLQPFEKMKEKLRQDKYQEVFQQKLKKYLQSLKSQVQIISY